MTRKALALLAAAALSACNDAGEGGGTTPDPGEPNDTLATATPLALGARAVATIASGADSDFYAFTVPPGGATVRFRTFDETGAACDPVNLTVDTFVRVFDAGGALVAWSDDSWAGPNGGGTRCEDFTAALPGGAASVAVSGYPPVPFVYTLEVTIP